ncbi:MAG: hypothetical protein ACK4TN_02340, partial [Brevinematales bacterium]
MANVEEGEFVLFGSKVPILSAELVKTSEVIFQQRIKGVPQQTLYRYETFLNVLRFPYVAVLPLKKDYIDEDIMPVLNSTVVAYMSEKNQGDFLMREVMAEEE